MFDSLTEILERYEPTQIAIAALLMCLGLVLVLAVIFRLLRRILRSRKRWIIIDGSNVMYWKTGNPRLDAVQDVVTALQASGWSVAVVFDANAGYLLSERYRHDEFFSRKLGLPETQVMVVPKGTPADPFILSAARDFSAKVVTNDRFRDWADDFPEVRTPGFLVRVENRKGEMQLTAVTAPR